MRPQILHRGHAQVGSKPFQCRVSGQMPVQRRQRPADSRARRSPGSTPMQTGAIKRDMSKRFAGMGVGQVQLDHRSAVARDRVAQRDGAVGYRRRRFRHDAGHRAARGRAGGRPARPLDVRLRAGDRQAQRRAMGDATPPRSSGAASCDRRSPVPAVPSRFRFGPFRTRIFMQSSPWALLYAALPLAKEEDTTRRHALVRCREASSQREAHRNPGKDCKDLKVKAMACQVMLMSRPVEGAGGVKGPAFQRTCQR